MSKKVSRGRVMSVLGLGYFVNSAQELSISVAYPAIKKSITALTNADLAYIEGIRIIVQTAVTPLWGMAADRFSRKRVLVIGTGFWGGLTILCGLADGYTQLLLAWVVACLGLGCLVPAGFSMLADLYGPDERGQAIGILNAIGMSGIIGMAVGGGVLLDRGPDGWRNLFFVIGGVSIFTGAALALFIREPPRGAAEPEFGDLIADLATSSFRFRLADIATVFKSATVWVAYIQGFCALTGMYLVVRFFTTWLVDDRHVAEGTASNLVGGVVIGLVAGSIVGGIASDRAEKKWPRRGRIMASQFSIAAIIPAMYYLFAVAQGTTAIVASAFVLAFFFDWTRRASLQPLIQNVMPPELRGTALALAEFFQGGVSSIIIMGIMKYADAAGIGLTRSIMYGGMTAWALAFVLALPLYAVYPSEYGRLRERMRERRDSLEEIKN